MGRGTTGAGAGQCCPESVISWLDLCWQVVRGRRSHQCDSQALVVGESPCLYLVVTRGKLDCHHVLRVAPNVLAMLSSWDTDGQIQQVAASCWSLLLGFMSNYYLN